MCYITESAIEHDNDNRGNKTCEKCGEDFKELFEVEYCNAEVANNWDGDSKEGEPEYTTLEVCEYCKRELETDKTLLVL